MARFSTREAAKKLGIDHSTLAKYIEAGKVPIPETVQQGKRLAHSWSERDIESLRKLLPKIANGRKTRWRRQREAQKKRTKAKRKDDEPRQQEQIPHRSKRFGMTNQPTGSARCWCTERALTKTA